MNDPAIFSARVDDVFAAAFRTVDAEEAAAEERKIREATELAQTQGAARTRDTEAVANAITRLDELTLYLRQGIKQLTEKFADAKIEVTQMDEFGRPEDDHGIQVHQPGCAYRELSFSSEERDRNILGVRVEYHGRAFAYTSGNGTFCDLSLADEAKREATSLKMIGEIVAHLARKRLIARPGSFPAPAQGGGKS